MLLNESGIRLPKGVTSAKVLAHKDLDGFMSALLTVNQLERQGIPKNRIDVQWVQYGKSDLLDKATRKNKYQAVLSVDFSAFPLIDLESTFSKLTKSSGGFKEKFATDYSAGKGKFPAFFKQFKGRKITAEEFRNWVRSNVGESADVIKDARGTYTDLNNFIKAMNSYKEGDDITKMKIVDLDFASDHHDNSKGDLTPGKAGSIAKTQFKSDTEHLATVTAQNLIGWEDLVEVSKIDSARYSDLENTISMSKELTGKDRKERLAILVSSLATSLISSNPRLATRAVKEASPSLLSVYNTVIRMSKLNDNQLRIFSELKKPNPDFSKIEELMDGFSSSERSRILSRQDEKGIKPIESIDAIRKKDIESRDANVSGERKDFTVSGNVLIQKAQNIKKNPPRYLGSLLSFNGKRYPFIVKRYSMLIQVQSNADIPADVKKDIDLGEICKKAVDEAEKKFGTFSNKWAWDIIRKESGGHKTIWNISGLTTLSASSLTGAERAENRYNKDFTSRVSKLSLPRARKKELTATKNETTKILEKKKTDADILNKVSDFLVDYVVRELNSKYGHINMPKFRDDYDVKE